MDRYGPMERRHRLQAIIATQVSFVAAAQMRLGNELDARVKRGTLDARVDVVKGIHQHSNVQLVHLGEETANRFVVLGLVQQQHAHAAVRHHGADEEVVVAVNGAQVRGAVFPLHLVHKVQRCVQDELRKERTG